MADIKVDQITYTKVPFPKNAVLEEPKETFFQMIRKAQIHALHEGIKANAIVINKNIVKVNQFAYGDGLGGIRYHLDLRAGCHFPARR